MYARRNNDGASVNEPEKENRVNRRTIARFAAFAGGMTIAFLAGTGFALGPVSVTAELDECGTIAETTVTRWGRDLHVKELQQAWNREGTDACYDAMWAEIEKKGN